MKQSARIVNSFVSEGTLVQTLGRDGKPVKRLIPRIPAKANRKLFDGPVVVLVDGRTSSGAEIVAGALKFLDRSLTVGSQTFGKGTVQKVYPLRKEEPKASLKLTVGRYFLPGQTFINSVGVTPDVATGTVWLDPNEVTFPDQLREPNALVGHSEPRGGLDGRRNPGGGWETASTGSNAAPKHRLWLPRVLEGWDPKEANELPSGNDDEGGSAPAESSPSDRSASDPPIAELKAGEATDRSPPASPGRAGTAGDAGDDVFNDMELRLAHEILREAAPTDRRGELLGRAGAVVQRWAQEQNARMAGALDLREIPWSEMPPPGWLDRAPAQAETLESRLLGPVPQGLVALLDLPESLHAGAPIDLCLSVRNERQEAIRHLRGILKSSSKLLNGASFLLADLGPGSTRKWCIPTTVPEGVATRWVPWRLYLLDDQGPLGGPVRGKAQFIGHPRPRLHLAVDRSTAPDPEGGVRVTLRVRVRNQGPGPTGNLRLRLGRTDPEDSVERLERFQNSEPLEEGQTGEVELNLRVRDPEAVPQVSVRLRAQDRRSSASTTVSLQLPTQGAAEEEAWSTPATVLLDEPQIDAGRGALVSTGPLPIRGQVQSASGLGSVVVLVGSDQIFSRDFSGSEPPMTLRLDLKAELSEGPNRIRIQAATAEGVERSVTFWVLGIQEPAAAP